MSLVNLKENYLYEKLPSGIINLDERALIQAVIGGFQDRIEDLRSYASKFELFLSPVGLPETGNNVILVTLQSSQGKVYVRSLDIKASTPAPTAPNSRLVEWAAEEIGYDVSGVISAVYGRDLLRVVDAKTLDYLAVTIGAVLYRSSILDNLAGVINSSGTFSASDLAHQQLIATYFPRLKFKGTPYSFDALGRLLGFDDVHMTPLWSRLSLREPNDPGAPANAVDFAAIPDYYPQPDRGPDYDPFAYRDGPFYTWTGTASAGTSATDFYTQVVNGFQPFIRITLNGSTPSGAVLHPASGSYVLADGAPYLRAHVQAGTSQLRFEALAEGEAYNGLAVQVFEVADGSLRGLAITDQLSTVKYRSSFYDLGMAVTFDKAEAAFGTQVARRNKDLAESPHTVESFSGSLTAISPYRGYRGGTATYDSPSEDFLQPFSGTLVSYVERTQAGVTDFQQNTDALQLAVTQGVQALEEVRPATRRVREATAGYLLEDTVGYAAYPAKSALFSVSSGSVSQTFSGSLIGHPLAPYTAAVAFHAPTSITQLGAELNDTDPNSVFYRAIVNGGTLSGQIAFTGSLPDSYAFQASGTFATGGTVCARYTVTSSELVRPEPYCSVAGTQVFAALGDYGYAGTNQTAVANMIEAWGAAAVIALGDNNYPDGSAATIVANNAVFADYNSRNRLLPTIGNHDYAPDAAGTDVSPHLDYFNIPASSSGNERYYNVRIGNVEFFCLNAGWNSNQASAAQGSLSYAITQEPDGNSFDSVQGQWLQAALSRSTARWKIVYVHFPPYTSSTTTNNYYPGFPRLRWPFKQWGAHAVMSGHVHAYERLDIDGLAYFVSGNGGQVNRVYTTPIVPGSQVRYDTSSTDYGALRIVATPTALLIQSWTVAGLLVDSYTLTGAANQCARQERPEDEIDTVLELTTVDEYPWRRDVVLGGNLVDTAFYQPLAAPVQVTPVEQVMSVPDQTGAEYRLYLITSPTQPYRIQPQAKTAEDYQPGLPAIGFRGTFRNLASLTANDLDYYVTEAGRTLSSRVEYDVLFEGAYGLYHIGLVNQVLVADPVRFNSGAHRSALVGWLPLNEHPDAALTVADVGNTLAVQALYGVAPEDRQYDATFGWVLRLQAGAQLVSTVSRSVTTAATVCLWLKPAALLVTTATPTVFRWGALSFTLADNANQLAVYVEDTASSSNLMGTLAVSTTEFSCVAISMEPGSVRFGVGTATTPFTWTTVAFSSRDFTPDDTTLVLRAGERAFTAHDVRLWRAAKTQAELDSLRDYAPQTTLVQYPLGECLTAGSGQRYGIQVLSSGWCVPAALPAAVERPSYARVVNYDSLGAYAGESRFEEVGLGGGQMPPSTYQLGNQGFNLTGVGQTVVSTQHGALPGVNTPWSADTAPGNYMVLNGSTSTGSLATSTASGSGATPWPNRMEATNPIQQHAWVRGDDGYVYQLGLASTGPTTARITAERTHRNRTDAELILSGDLQVLATSGSAYTVTSRGSIYPNQLLITAGTSVAVDDGAGALVPSGQIYGGSIVAATGAVTVLTSGVEQVRVLMPKTLYFAEQPTGAITEIATPGTLVSVSAAGSVYQKTYSGTITRPDTYLYLNEQVQVDATGSDLMARWVEPNADGLALGTPLLTEAGELSFTNSGTLLAGNYTLQLVSGNVGQVDAEFQGFRVELEVGDALLARTLCAGQSGANFQQQDTFSFELAETIVGEWLLVLRWFNAYTDPAKGTQRQLQLKRYALNRLATQTYRLSVAATGTTPDCTYLPIAVTGQGTLPGGWLANYNSYGTTASWDHESQVYSRNDTLVNLRPLSDVWTGRTAERREDIIITASGSGTNTPYYVSPDAPDPVFTSFGTGISVL